MKFLTAQPDSDFYIWQLQVQMYNFRKFGIEDKSIILLGYNSKIGVNPAAISFKESTSARVIFLPDNRDLSERLYQPSIRPHLIKQIYGIIPELLENKSVLYHDSDILFTRLPILKDLVNMRKIFVSNTRVNTKASLLCDRPDILKDLCKIVGISPSVVVKNDGTSGGLQYLFTTNFNLSYDFWDKVEKDSNLIYKTLLVSETPMHILLSDIWSLLWNMWLMGLDTEIINELSYCTADSNIEELEINNIYHNTGVSSKEKDFLFYKGDFFNENPFNADLSYVNKNYCSIFYVNEIIEAANSFKLKN